MAATNWLLINSTAIILLYCVMVNGKYVKSLSHTTYCIIENLCLVSLHFQSFFFTVTTGLVRLSGGIIIESKLDNISKAKEFGINAYFQQRGYRKSYELVSDGDSQHLQTSFKNYYYPSAVSVEDYDLLKAFTNKSISVEDAKMLMQEFIFKIEAAERQEIDPSNIWSIDFLSPTNATSIRLPVTRFVILLHYYKDCSQAKELCDQLNTTM